MGIAARQWHDGEVLDGGCERRAGRRGPRTRPTPGHDPSVPRPDRLAQAIAEQVVKVVVDALDINALLARIDVSALLDRVDMNEVVAKIDIDELVARLDVDALISRWTWTR